MIEQEIQRIKVGTILMNDRSKKKRIVISILLDDGDITLFHSSMSTGLGYTLKYHVHILNYENWTILKE